MPSATDKTQDAEMAQILSDNQESAEQIRAAANELDVVHAVLATQIPTSALKADLQAAVERTDQLEQQLSETAEALNQSNERLQRHIADQESSK
ncbi:hypothetical protein LJR129_001914 [Acidovorax sp. LjRoot129]|uniref:hypothetical protein n=1 Tax=Acidovorax sp. LjRoot129 TaxID=3342260 RepID=UPI001200DFCE|nr:MAG: hypothetical protein EON50_12375 [Acidovorax sp.]